MMQKVIFNTDDKPSFLHAAGEFLFDTFFGAESDGRNKKN